MNISLFMFTYLKGIMVIQPLSPLRLADTTHHPAPISIGETSANRPQRQLVLFVFLMAKNELHPWDSRSLSIT